jgi:hypothetical protein
MACDGGGVVTPALMVGDAVEEQFAVAVSAAMLPASLDVGD